ncbi:NAD(P)-dependent oxidoreductase [Ferviditalea candida]|uniref:NAD(P)-dependent oxidoreductase n=1 Tax=Ferviditalea candida TaxID=3108399 RepID=A0ABU5ZF24_9BACL|nr:NAD(P)-dependent oxidoreductase [Paenibacillaceae bacterium T2]
MSKGKIGFIGLGNMGEPMVRVLLQAGYEVSVVPHRRKEPAERLAAEGALIVGNPKEAAQGSGFVITMVPNLPQIEEVVFGDEGIVHGAEPGLILLNMSTVSPSGITELAARMEPYGMKICDAPVSGGPMRAANGTLSIMAGTDAEVFEQTREVLETLGENIFYTGKLGTGQVAKLCNNMIGATLMAINSEVLTVGVKAGVNAEVLREIILKSTGGNFQLEHWMPRNVMVNEYEAGFALKLMYKDIGLARELAKENQSPLLIGNLVHELYGLFMNSDLKDKDFSVVSTFFQDAANITISDGKPRSG